MTELEEGYYQINNTKKILYWDGEKWMKPKKDVRGNYGGWIEPLEKQPKIKSTTPVEDTEYAPLFRRL